MAKRPELLVTTGELAGKRFKVPDGGLRFGRSSSNDVHVADEELSRSHCLFECDGDVVRVIDLASANGTFVNGEQLGAEARALKPGDVIEAGATAMSVVAEGEEPKPPAAAHVASEAESALRIHAGGAAGGAAGPAPGSVDLGLGGAANGGGAAGGPGGASGAVAANGRRPNANLIWTVAAVLFAVAAGVMLLNFPVGGSSRSGDDAAAAKSGKANKEFVSLSYEKVDADPAHVFRYCVEIDAAGAVKVAYDDVPGENRHFETEGNLSKADLAELGRIFDSDDWADVVKDGGVYSGPSVTSANYLKSWRIRLVRGGAVADARIENTSEPDRFRPVRERLETLVNNALGVQSLQRSRGELAQSSAYNEELGDKMWEERDVKDGNLYEAIRFYSLAKNDLATLGSNADDVSRIQSKIEEASAELKRRYDDKRFEADRAAKIGDWEVALVRFREICDMIPDRSDQRNSEARAYMVDVENRMEAAKKGGKRK